MWRSKLQSCPMWCNTVSTLFFKWSSGTKAQVLGEALCYKHHFTLSFREIAAVRSAPVGYDNWGGLVCLHLLCLHPDMGRHVIRDPSAGQTRVTPKVFGVVKVLQGVASQSICSLPVHGLPLLGGVEQRAALRLRGVRGQVRLHVVFGEGQSRSGHPIWAWAAEAGQRSRAGCVFVVVVEGFELVLVVEAFGGEVNKRGTRASAHHTGHVELTVMGQSRRIAGAVGFGEAWNVQRGLVLLLKPSLFLFDHLLRGSDQRLHLTRLSGAGPEVVAMVTLARVAGGSSAVRRAHDTVFVPVTPSCRKDWVVQITNQSNKYFSACILVLGLAILSNLF